MSLTPAIREFLVRLETLIDAKGWPGLDRARMSTTSVGDAARVVLPTFDPTQEPVELEVRDREVIVRYPPERILFTSKDEALQFIEMLGDGRITLDVVRNGLWTTMQSYCDGNPVPFRRTRMPWMTLHRRTEHVRFRFTS